MTQPRARWVGHNWTRIYNEARAAERRLDGLIHLSREYQHGALDRVGDRRVRGLAQLVKEHMDRIIALLPEED